MTLRPISLIGARIGVGHGLLLRPGNRFCNGFIAKMSQTAGQRPKGGKNGAWWAAILPGLGQASVSTEEMPRICRSVASGLAPESPKSDHISGALAVYFDVIDQEWHAQ